MRVIVVEDEKRLARALKKGLQRHGFAVDVVSNGIEAFEHITIHHSIYDLIIMDLMLPSMPGNEICTKLKERGITTPILILTAKDRTADKVVLLNSGADDYMTKPFALAEVIARTNALLRRPHNAYPGELTLLNLRLDVGNHRVFKDEVELFLTVKEFAILEFFMRHPDQVLDREHILDHVWDFNFNSFSNVVDVHIKNLRKKLGKTKSNEEYIQTVPGVGYRFKGQN